MSDKQMSEIIKSSLEGIKDFCDVDTVFGKAITTSSGVTIIPVSKVTIGFASGGLDYSPQKKFTSSQNFGGGSGTGVSVSPVAFLTVNHNSEINLIEIGKNRPISSLERTLDIIESSPDIIKKIKDSFS